MLPPTIEKGPLVMWGALDTSLDTCCPLRLLPLEAFRHTCRQKCTLLFARSVMHFGSSAFRLLYVIFV